MKFTVGVSTSLLLFMIAELDGSPHIRNESQRRTLSIIKERSIARAIPGGYLSRSPSPMPSEVTEDLPVRSASNREDVDVASLHDGHSAPSQAGSLSPHVCGRFDTGIAAAAHQLVCLEDAPQMSEDGTSSVRSEDTFSELYADRAWMTAAWVEDVQRARIAQPDVLQPDALRSMKNQSPLSDKENRQPSGVVPTKPSDSPLRKIASLALQGKVRSEDSPALGDCHRLAPNGCTEQARCKTREKSKIRESRALPYDRKAPISSKAQAKKDARKELITEQWQLAFRNYVDKWTGFLYEPTYQVKSIDDLPFPVMGAFSSYFGPEKKARILVFLRYLASNGQELVPLSDPRLAQTIKDNYELFCPNREIKVLSHIDIDHHLIMDCFVYMQVILGEIMSEIYALEA
jgi:hypothetical protein